MHPIVRVAVWATWLLMAAAFFLWWFWPRAGYGAPKEPSPESQLEEVIEWDYAESIARIRAEERARYGPTSLEESAQRDPVRELQGHVVALQPAFSRYPHRARQIAEAIDEAAEQHMIDPRLLLAVAHRESSLRSDVRGRQGEHGLLQIMPRSYPMRACGRGRDMSQLAANVDTGACYLAHVRDLCGGSTWRWVGAYGMSRCPEERTARTLRSTRRARSILCRIDSEACATIWPE